MGEHDTADIGLVVTVADFRTEGIFRNRMLCISSHLSYKPSAPPSPPPPPPPAGLHAPFSA